MKTYKLAASLFISYDLQPLTERYEAEAVEWLGYTDWILGQMLNLMYTCERFRRLQTPRRIPMQRAENHTLIYYWYSPYLVNLSTIRAVPSRRAVPLLLGLRVWTLLGARLSVCCKCCVLYRYPPTRRADTSPRGVLPSVYVYMCVVRCNNPLHRLQSVDTTGWAKNNHN